LLASGCTPGKRQGGAGIDMQGAKRTLTGPLREEIV